MPPEPGRCDRAGRRRDPSRATAFTLSGMQPSQTGETGPKMPGQVITAMVLLWISAASGFFLTFMSWADHSARVTHNQDSGAELAMALFTTAVFAATVAVLIGLYKRNESARTGGLFLAGVSIMTGLIAFFLTFSPLMMVNLAISGVLFGMLVSDQARWWCEQ